MNNSEVKDVVGKYMEKNKKLIVSEKNIQVFNRKNTKHIFAIIFTLFFMGSGNLYVSAEESNVVEIYTAEDLQAIESNTSKSDPNTTFILMNDIDCSSIEDFDPIDTFGAEFDGAGYTISNYNSTTNGLFGSTKNTAYIHDVTIGGATKISGYKGSIGGLVGQNKGTIENCCVTGDVFGSANAHTSGDGKSGGLVGQNEGTISDSYATGNVSGGVAGGLVGANSGTINDSYATGNIDSAGDAGGLVCWNHGTISNSYATGNVTGSEYAGGLVGFNKGTIDNSYAIGSVEADVAGGLVGENLGTISNSYATGSMTGVLSKPVFDGVAEGVAGGLVGDNKGTISNSYAIGDVTGRGSAGGLVGLNSDGTINNSYEYEGQIINRFSINPTTSGGAIGIATYSEISSSDWHQNTLLMGDQFVYSDGYYPQVIDSNTGEPLTGQVSTPVSTPVRRFGDASLILVVGLIVIIILFIKRRKSRSLVGE